MTSKFKKNEEVICRFIHHNAPPKVLLDVGVGPKTEYLTLLEHYPDMRLIGLEPCIPTFLELIPKFSGILLPYGAWHEETCLELYISDNNLEISSVFPHKNNEEKTQKIYTKTLDSIDKHLGYLDRILLWMDVEGAELMALKGAKNLLLSKRIKWINLEVRDHWSRTDACVKQDIDELLIPLGYREKLQYNHHNRGTKAEHRDVIYVHEDELLKISELKKNATKE